MGERMTDLYSDFARRLGTSREEAKRRTYQRLYSAGVEVLAPGEPVPASVRLPQVVSTSEDIERMAWRMRTKAGQRFLVPHEVAHGMNRKADELFPDVVLGEALERGSAVWL